MQEYKLLSLPETIYSTYIMLHCFIFIFYLLLGLLSLFFITFSMSLLYAK